jgi:hypothetical protein
MSMVGKGMFGTRNAQMCGVVVFWLIFTVHLWCLVLDVGDKSQFLTKKRYAACFSAVFLVQALCAYYLEDGKSLLQIPV